VAISYIENMQDNTPREITWKALRHADSSLAVPFKLVLNEHETPVYCEEIVRIVPGKRLVVFGTWGERQVVVKLFYERQKARIHAKREITGVEALAAVSIPTPKLLFKGEARNKQLQILLFERIFDAKNLEDIWQQRHERKNIKTLFDAVIVELATQHVLGITQHDLHFKNFLVKGKKIYTLDGSSIESCEQILDKKASLDNLALFFAQLGVGTEKLQKRLFEKYASSRGWIVKKADVEYLSAAIKKWNEQRWERYSKKVMRNCTAFARKNTSRALIMYDRSYYSPALQNLLAHPDAIFLDPQTEMLKSGKSSTVVKVLIDNQYFVIKRYNIKSFWHGLRRCLRSTRAASSWRLANLLRLFGISTAKPIAFIENRFLGLRGKSYFMMEYVEGKNLGEYFSNYKIGEESFIKVARRVVRLLKNLAKLYISHGDLKMTNILVHNEKPVLIDLDGTIEHKGKGETKRGFKREVKRFMENWTAMPSVRALFEKLF